MKGWKTTWIKQTTYDKLKEIKQEEEKIQYLVNKAVEEYIEKVKEVTDEQETKET